VLLEALLMELPPLTSMPSWYMPLMEHSIANCHKESVLALAKYWADNMFGMPACDGGGDLFYPFSCISHFFRCGAADPKCFDTPAAGPNLRGHPA
jgi:hypothetical protein